MVARFLVAGLMLATACAGWCDSITVKGQAYNDVLIHTSSNFYYITLPDEGRVMTVALADVDPATVAIKTKPRTAAPSRRRTKPIERIPKKGPILRWTRRKSLPTRRPRSAPQTTRSLTPTFPPNRPRARRRPAAGAGLA